MNSRERGVLLALLLWDAQVECVALGRYLWREGGKLHVPPWTWGAPGWVDLGPTTSLIDFSRIAK